MIPGNEYSISDPNTDLEVEAAVLNDKQGTVT